VQVKHALPGLRPVVDRETKGILHAQLPRDLVGGEQQVAKERLVFFPGVGEPRDFLLGNDQDVRGRLGIDIAKSETQIVFVHDVGGAFVGHYLLKQCLTHSRVGH
jgi:hypothetical protein